MIGILPTIDDGHLGADSFSRQPALRLLNEQIFAARGEDMRHRDRRAERLRPTPRRSRRRRPARACSCTCRSTPDAFAGYWNAAQAIAGVAAGRRRQLAVPVRQGAVARDPHRAVRAGHRHPAGGAQGAGRPPARVVRRALDHLDLRPLRGERPLLPGAAADRATTRTRVAVLERGDVPRPGRAAAAQRHGLPLEPAGLRRRATAARTCGWRTACCPPADRRRHPRQRRLLLRPGARARRGGAAGVVADVVLGGRGELPRRRARRHRRARVLARGWARCPSPSWSCGGCCRSPTRGSRRWGVDAGDRERLLGIIERRCVEQRNGASWQAAPSTPLGGSASSTAPTRCAR